MTIKLGTVSARLLFVTASFLLTVEFASPSLGEMRTETSKPKPVDPRENNAWFRQLIPSLLVTLDINGKEISLGYAQVVKAPQSKPRRQEGELILLTGVSHGQAVSSVRVPDERVNVAEKKGLVIMEKRTIIAILPLPVRIDTMEVRLPGMAEAVRLDVHETIDKFCKSSRQMALCQSEKQ